MSAPPSKDRPDLSTLSSDEIFVHLPGLDPAGLDQLLGNPEFGEKHVLSFLSSPGVGEEMLTRIYKERALTKRYRVRCALAGHPNMPRVLALELVHQLFWRDLLRVAENLRLHAHVRRAAEELLRENVEVLTLGEKISLARLATRGIIRAMRKETEPKVVEALLQNPRLNEEDILVMVGRPGAPPNVLQQVGRSSRWSTRYPVRLALVRNPGTPPGVALSFLSSLSRTDLNILVSTPGLAKIVRDGAKNVLKKEGPRR
jgi:hypothetical protein